MTSNLLARFLVPALLVSLTACPGGKIDKPDGGLPEGDGGADPAPDAGKLLPDGGIPIADTDLALVRLNSNGSRDDGFGTAGVLRVDLGVGEGSARDTVWGARTDAQDRLVLFGGRKGDGRSDMDRVVVRLSKNGVVDTSFATRGFHTLNQSNLGDNARHGFIQSDGKIVASGYVAAPTGVGTQTANSIVLLRLNEDGSPDLSFGTEGVVSFNPFKPADPVATPWGMAEAYSVVQQGDKYVTAGYGRVASSGPVDVVAARFLSHGAVDDAFGTRGVTTLDVAGDNDRGRNLVALPNNRVLVVGSGIQTTGNIDAMAVMLDLDGKLDTSFGVGGRQFFDFGRADEAFFGVALSKDQRQVAAVGYRVGTAGNLESNDDALLLLVPLDGSAPQALAVPLSNSANDRLLDVAFGADGKIYATGYISEAKDNQMAVVRFNADGTRDNSFGTNGVVTVNVVKGGADELARAVMVQSDGKIVVAGPAEVQ